jgi:putative transcriptional regulator
MAIRINLDVMMARRKMSLNKLAEKVGITQANLSILKNERAKAIRLSTLDKLCAVLQCKPGELIDYSPAQDEETHES